MFSKRLKYLRIEKKLTQQAMADFLGISRQGYGKYEDGKSEPDHDTLIKLSSFFKVTTDYLLGNTDVPSTKTDNSFNAIDEINQLLKKYNIDQSGFFDIEKWKAMGPEGVKQLDSYFKFLTEQAEKENKDNPLKNKGGFKKS
ncbi:helix-turn-helix domain-containing protein [Virgibacillus halophilus]|uniref:helix-turn-helix domain-containing protein n=1 Tax=Tigheibacillus halophilus TaxID=361280 RepID=UPI00363FC8BA